MFLTRYKQAHHAIANSDAIHRIRFLSKFVGRVTGSRDEIQPEFFPTFIF